MQNSDGAEAEAGLQTSHAPGRSREEAIAWWQERGLPIDAQTVQCPYCGREYLRPCAEDNHAHCMNFLHRAGSTPARTSSP